MRHADLTAEQQRTLSDTLAIILPLQAQIRELKAAMAPAVAAWRARGGLSEILPALGDREQLPLPDGKAEPMIAKERLVIVPFEVLLIREEGE